jgi:hypothetical protein
VGVVGDQGGPGLKGRHQLVVVGVRDDYLGCPGRVNRRGTLHQAPNLLQVRLTAGGACQDDLVLAAQGGAEDRRQLTAQAGFNDRRLALPGL